MAQTQVKSARDTRIAYLTINPSGAFVHWLQEGFLQHGFLPAHMIVVSPLQRIAQQWRRERFAILQEAKNRVHQMRARQTSVTLENVRRHYVMHLNSTRTLQRLRDLGVEIVVNAGGGIVREPLVSAKDMTILNAHAGRLPHYRNMNVVEWGLYVEGEVYGTVHRITRGIDTGPIYAQKKLDLSCAQSIAGARDAAFRQVALMVAPVVDDILNKGKEPQPQKRGGKSWYTMHSAMRGAVNARLRAAQKAPSS